MQRFTIALQNRYSSELCKFHRNISVSKSLLKNVAGDLIKRLQHKWFPVKFAKFLRAPFFTDHLLLLLFKISNINNLFKDFPAIHA